MPRATACASPSRRYDPAEISAWVDRSIRTFTPNFFADRAGQGGARRATRSSSSGCSARARPWSSRSSPAIPRSRARPSLPTCPTSSATSAKRRPREASRSSATCRRSTPAELRALGRDLSRRAAASIARTDRPAIHRQDAQQLDVRRADPADPAQRPHHRCPPPPDGLLLLQLEAALRAAASTIRNALDTMGHYYADYVRLMRHFDAAQPGKVHRVIYERSGRRRRRRGAPPARLSRLAVRPGLPRLPLQSSARCGRSAPTRCASRSTARGSTSGARSSRGSDPLKEALGPALERLAAYRDRTTTDDLFRGHRGRRPRPCSAIMT